MSTLINDVTKKLLKVYSGKTFRHTETVNHGGTVIAFAMDENRRIYYAPLENEVDDVERGEYDASFWPEDPDELQFPREIGKVGYSLLGATPIPDVHGISKEEKAHGEIEESEREKFLSSTARLSALAPFLPFSDGKYIILFRQALGPNHSDQLFRLQTGGVAAGNSRDQDEYATSNNQKVPLVNKTLLCDRFVLVGGKLTKAREVRYRRSRHATRPASRTDTLGATDMEGGNFYMPTQELSFIENLEGRPFSVLQLPTAISDYYRWQIMVHNAVSDRIDMYNLEVNKDGLFNLKGSQLYTSPNEEYKKSVLERTPGNCPFTDQPLIPLIVTSGHAETCMVVRDTVGKADGTISSWASTAFTIEAWVKSNQGPPSSWTGSSSGDALFVSHTSAHVGRFMIEVNEAGNWIFRYCQANSELKLSFRVAYSHTAWVHLAVSYDGTTLRGYANGLEKFSQTCSLSVYVENFRIGADENGTKWFKGKVDEVRLWSRACAGLQIKNERMKRLLGIEKGLVGYWTFDEGLGTKAANQVSGGAELTLSGGAKFVNSDCPIGAHNGLRRDSFAINGRNITGGVSASYYFQQEKVATGYDGISKPMKKQARVLLAVGTTATGGGDPSVATLDVGVSKFGRFAQFPDMVSLSNVVIPPTVLNRKRLRFLDNEIEVLRAEREVLKAISELPDHSAVRQMFESTRADMFEVLIQMQLTIPFGLLERIAFRISDHCAQIRQRR